jgi:hypothetical protein
MLISSITQAVNQFGAVAVNNVLVISVIIIIEMNGV